MRYPINCKHSIVLFLYYYYILDWGKCQTFSTNDRVYTEILVSTFLSHYITRISFDIWFPWNLFNFIIFRHQKVHNEFHSSKRLLHYLKPHYEPLPGLVWDELIDERNFCKSCIYCLLMFIDSITGFFSKFKTIYLIIIYLGCWLVYIVM